MTDNGFMALIEFVILYINEIALIIFISCFFVYFLLLWRRVNQHAATDIRVFKLIYKNWVKSLISSEDHLIGIHALRNFIRGNSTFVSALFILLGLLVGFYQTTFDITGKFFAIQGISVPLMKLTLTIMVTIFCLMNFILAIRFSSRLSLLLAGNPSQFSLGEIEGQKITGETLEKAHNHWMLGVRGLFFLLGTLFWYINAGVFIVGNIIIFAYLLSALDYI